MAKCPKCQCGGSVKPLIGRISSNFADAGGRICVSIQPDKKYIANGYCENCKQMFHPSIFTQKQEKQALKG